MKRGGWGLLNRLGTKVGRVEVDEGAVIFGGFLGPQCLDGLDALVQQRTPPRLGVGAVVAQLLDVPACTDTEYEPPTGDDVDAGGFLCGEDGGVTLDEKGDASEQFDPGRHRCGCGQRHERVQRPVVVLG